MSPDDNGPPFLQLYIVDTDHDFSNMLNVFHDPLKAPLDQHIVATLMEELTIHNAYVRTFKTTKEIVVAGQLESYDVCIFNNVLIIDMMLHCQGH